MVSLIWKLLGIGSIASLNAPALAQEATGCAAVAQYQASILAQDPKTNIIQLPAAVAYECLTSIPFNATDASNFLDFYRTYLNFHSTFAYLKNPPPSYQQPAVDILSEYDVIAANAKSGAYQNQYDFETALLKLLYSAHDGHLGVFFGANTIFSFSAPADLHLVSVSNNQTELPQVYVYDDVIIAETVQNLTWTPSAVVSINGQDSTDWLRKLVTPAIFVEEHAIWNWLFASEARAVGGQPSSLQSMAIYPGEYFNLTFSNGTTTPSLFLASYLVELYNFTAGIDGQKVYENFVATPSEAPAGPSSTSAPEPTKTPAGLKRLPKPYPQDPVIVQPGLGSSTTDGGFLTGYFLESSVAVLSVPSFSMYGPYAQTFDETVAKFLNLSKAAGMQKVIIDLQGNGGGDALLGTDLFKHFFPQLTPYDGANLRVHPTMKTLLSTFSNVTLLDAVGVTVSELGSHFWVAQSYLDANGGSVKTWEQIYGPVPINGDNFTKTVQNNFSNAAVDYDASGEGIVVYGYANRTTTAQAPYAAEDILLVVDGFCTSTCSLLVEKMKTNAGVRTVTFGGLPEYGPMQGDAGSRGANDYTTDTLDKEIVLARALANNETERELFPEITVQQSPYQSFSGEVNLKNQLRRGEDMPLQFVYEASDCRLFFTPAMIVDYAVLWQAAADAIWGNGTCVQGSTGQPSAGNITETSAPGPAMPSATGVAPYTGAASQIVPKLAAIVLLMGTIVVLAA